MRDYNRQLEREILFVYQCRTAEDALFWPEFEQATTNHANFQIYRQLSSQDGRLSAVQIAKINAGDIGKKEIYLCSPEVMVKNFRKQFRGLEVPSRQIHYEEFRFR
jgi:predicted ferric reductase